MFRNRRDRQNRQSQHAPPNLPCSQTRPHSDNLAPLPRQRTGPQNKGVFWKARGGPRRAPDGLSQGPRNGQGRLQGGLGSAEGQDHAGAVVGSLQGLEHSGRLRTGATAALEDRRVVIVLALFLRWLSS